MGENNTIITLIISAFLTTLPVITHSAQQAGLPQYDRTRILEEGRYITDEQLTNQHGEEFSLGDLKGRVALVFFGFTNCPDVCPMTMAKFRQLQDTGTVAEDDVAFVLISVDGERDSPAVLKDFLERFSPDFIGLTGDKDRVKALSKRFSASFYKGSVSEKDGGYSVMHSPQTFVLDPEGRLRAELYNPTVEVMSDIVSALLSER